MTAPLCFVDTETDGLHPGRKAWEVALIRRELDGRETEESFFLTIDLSTADPAGLRIGRFYERHPLGRRLSHPAAAAAPKVRAITSAIPLIARMTHGARIVGAVPNFDTEVLERILRENGLTPAWRYQLVDVETLTAGHFHRHVGGLAKCAEALGIQVRDEHTALGDARTARAIYDAIMAERAEVAA